MHLYEIILDILDKKGPLSIPSIMNEINNNTYYLESRENAVQISNIKSAISRKKDLFILNNHIVFIHPNREFISLTVNINQQDSSFKLKVDFDAESFYILQWRSRNDSSKGNQTCYTGTVEDLKRNLYRLQLWNWNVENIARNDSNIDGIDWEVKLETTGREYKICGNDCFPKEWKMLCHALNKLIGMKFC